MRVPAKFFTATLVMVALTSAGLAGVAAAGERLAKRQFLRQANVTCKRAYNAVNATFEDAFAGLGENEGPSPAQIEAAVAGSVAIFQAAASDIEALQGPAALERKVDTFLERFNAVVDEFEADPLGTFEEELSGYVFARPDRFAKKVGLKECAQRH